MGAHTYTCIYICMLQCTHTRMHVHTHTHIIGASHFIVDASSQGCHCCFCCCLLILLLIVIVAVVFLLLIIIITFYLARFFCFFVSFFASSFLFLFFASSFFEGCIMQLHYKKRKEKCLDLLISFNPLLFIKIYKLRYIMYIFTMLCFLLLTKNQAKRNAFHFA